MLACQDTLENLGSPVRDEETYLLTESACCRPLCVSWIVCMLLTYWIVSFMSSPRDLVVRSNAVYSWCNRVDRFGGGPSHHSVAESPLERF